MRTLALVAAAIFVIAVAAVLIVWIAVAIRTRLGRARPAEAGTESAGNALGATGPGVVSLVSTTPGPALREFCATCGEWQPGQHKTWCYRFSPLQAAAANARSAMAALTPDDPGLPVDLTSEWWRANPTEPLGLSELVRWNDITEKYEWVAVPVVVPGRES